MTDRSEVAAINDMAARETAAHLERSAKSFAETAIHLMMTCMKPAAVIAFLERQVEILKEYG